MPKTKISQSPIRVSVLITVYWGSEVEWFNECINSIYCQKEYIQEVVLVEDGKIRDDLKNTIKQWEKKWSFTRLQLDKSCGPGGASQSGLNICACKWVARLDADDIASPDRFKLQTEFLANNPQVDVLGGYMPEFQGLKEKTFAINYVPLTHAKIARRISLRSPMVNSSAIFRKDKALNAGGYESLFSHEDHLLWLAMLKNNAIFANLPKLMGYYRASPEYYNRRRGWRVIKTEWTFQCLALARGYISSYEFWRNLILRIPPRFLPGFLLEIFYKIFLRHSFKRGEL